MDVAVLTQVCQEIPHALGVVGAVVIVLEPLETAHGAVFGSDSTATIMGELQHRETQGPLPSAIRSGRALLTSDLTRVGPPALAAAAAESGLMSSAAIPLLAAGSALGGLQLLGTYDRPVAGRHVDDVGPLLEVLAVRLAEVRARRGLSDEIARLSMLQAMVSIERATGMLAERHRIDGDEAAQRLHSQARAAGVNVTAAATSVINGSDGPVAVPMPRRDGDLSVISPVRVRVPTARHRRGGAR